MKRSLPFARPWVSLLILMTPLIFPSTRCRAADSASEEIAPIKAPFDMPPLQRPTFPDRRVNIRDFGAVEGGATKATAAFAWAIAACAEQGGGHVIVPKGKWLTGAIHLRSQIDLHLEEGAEIVFSDLPEDYLPPVFVRSGGIEIYNYSPLVYARDCENVAVTGPGLLTGNGKAWWDRKGKESGEPFRMAAEGVPVEKRVFGTPEAGVRPSFVSFVHCRQVLLEGFTITSGPMWTIHPVYCENVIIRRVHIDTHGPNNDGMDPDSCRNVLVEYCTFTTGDDCMVLKSGYNEDGWRVGKPTENVVMRFCKAAEGHGGLVIGSEMSGGVRNVFMHDCSFDGTDHAVRIKSRLDRGGVVENVWVRHVRAENLKRDVVIINMDYGSDRQAMGKPKPPVFRNFHLEDITVHGAPAAIVMTGAEGSPIQDVHFVDLTIESKKGVVAKFIKDCTFERVKIDVPKGPVFDLTDTDGVTLGSPTEPVAKGVFLKVQGPRTTGVVIERADAAGEPPTYELGDGVMRDAVTVKLASPSR